MTDKQQNAPAIDNRNVAAGCEKFSAKEVYLNQVFEIAERCIKIAAPGLSENLRRHSARTIAQRVAAIGQWKVETYSRPECRFAYCPHGEICRDRDICGLPKTDALSRPVEAGEVVKEARELNARLRETAGCSLDDKAIATIDALCSLVEGLQGEVGRLNAQVKGGIEHGNRQSAEVYRLAQECRTWKELHEHTAPISRAAESRATALQAERDGLRKVVTAQQLIDSFMRKDGASYLATIKDCQAELRALAALHAGETG